MNYFINNKKIIKSNKIPKNFENNFAVFNLNVTKEKK